MSEREEIAGLIDKFLRGEATEEEILVLEKWIGASPENRKFYLGIKNITEITGNELKSEEIDTAGALNKVQVTVLPSKGSFRLVNTLQRIAAVLFIPLLVTTFFIGRSVNQRKVRDLQKPVYNEVSAAFGTRSAVILSDGSKVWLNAGSRFKYPDRFNEDTREVYLWGEAYFEVRSDITSPFIVKSGNMEVIATGTEFNVSTLDPDRLFEVTLVSGKVTVQRTPNGAKPVVISEMEPSQFMKYDSISGSSEISVVDTYKYIAWKDGKLVFRNDPLGEVMEKIGYFYNVDIELRGEELKEYPYRATLEQETISEILKLLKHSAPIDYVELPRKILPDGTFSKKQVVIFPVNEEL